MITHAYSKPVCCVVCAGFLGLAGPSLFDESAKYSGLFNNSVLQSENSLFQIIPCLPKVTKHRMGNGFSLFWFIGWLLVLAKLQGYHNVTVSAIFIVVWISTLVSLMKPGGPLALKKTAFEILVSTMHFYRLARVLFVFLDCTKHSGLLTNSVQPAGNSS